MVEGKDKIIDVRADCQIITRERVELDDGEDDTECEDGLE